MVDLLESIRLSLNLPSDWILPVVSIVLLFGGNVLLYHKGMPGLLVIILGAFGLTLTIGQVAAPTKAYLLEQGMWLESQLIDIIPLIFFVVVFLSAVLQFRGSKDKDEIRNPTHTY